jgi:hypothetical protein
VGSGSRGASRRLFVVALCVLLGGCSSTTRFFYNRLNIVLPWYLERYVDLDRGQAQQFDAQVEALLAWHRREELPQYVLLLDDVLARLDGPLTTADVIEFGDEAELAWYRVRDRALDELLLLGAQLSDEQVGEFLAKLQEKQEKFEDKYLPRDEEEFRDDAADNLRDTLEDYLGRLDPPQREIVLAAARDLQRSDALWLAERQRWIDVLHTELVRAPGWQQRIRRQVLGWEATLDSDTTSAYDHNTLVVQEAIAAVVDARSDKQDRRLRRKLVDLRDDLQQLHEQGAED